MVPDEVEQTVQRAIHVQLLYTKDESDIRIEASEQDEQRWTPGPARRDVRNSKARGQDPQSEKPDQMDRHQDQRSLTSEFSKRDNKPAKRVVQVRKNDVSCLAR